LLIAAETALVRIGSRLSERVRSSTEFVRLEHGLNAAELADLESEAATLSLAEAIEFALEPVQDGFFAVLT
jgi:hypothetical protein